MVATGLGPLLTAFHWVVMTPGVSACFLGHGEGLIPCERYSGAGVRRYRWLSSLLLPSLPFRSYRPSPRAA